VISDATTPPPVGAKMAGGEEREGEAEGQEALLGTLRVKIFDQTWKK